MPNPFAAACHDAWAARYGLKPPWGAKEYVALSTARKRLPDDARAHAAWAAFLACEDPFYQGHEPGLFLARLSKFLVLSLEGVKSSEDGLTAQEKQNRADRRKFNQWR